MTARYRRGDLLDTLIADGEALVLVSPNELMKLSPVSVTLLQGAMSPTTQERLCSLVEQQHGAPADGNTAVAVGAVLESLVAAGVLVRSTDG
mgnify:CR=1 FL=1